MYYLKIYLGLAWKDVLRLWSATQLQIIIIAGICLPILLLLGLKRGHVADLREELVKSPTGRQVIFWSSNQENFLSDVMLRQLESEIEGVELIIPESQRLLFYDPAAADNSEFQQSSAIGITLYSTLPGDPLLKQFGVDLADEEEGQIIVSKSFADAVGIAVGDEMPLIAKRRVGREKSEHKLIFQVKGILPTGDSGDGGKIGYTSIKTMNRLEKFGRGNAIPEWSVASLESLKAVDTYRKMICVCLNEPGSILTEKDHEFLARRGLKATAADLEDIQGFSELLKPNSKSEILAYEIGQLSESETGRLVINDAPNFLAANTEAIDDFFLRWTDPKSVTVGEKKLILIGATLPSGRETGGWIQDYIKDEVNWYNFEDSVQQTNTFKTFERNAKPFLEIKLGNDVRIPLTIFQSPKNPDGNIVNKESDENVESQNEKSTEELTKSDVGIDIVVPDKLTVPVTFVSYLEQVIAGDTIYDHSSGKFVASPKPIEYTKARLYTSTIDNVPQTVESLSDRDFAVLSESSRIAEIQEQDQSLQILVTVTAAGVFLFGIVTVFNVLVDSTDRKRGTIGVLRVMGTSRFGIFFMVLFRALIIGLLAAVLCTIAGIGISAFLNADLRDSQWLTWKPIISLTVHHLDLLLVASGAILCAILGAVMPAFKASRLDPFDAIMEGRFS